MSFIDEYRDFILNYIPTNYDWAESVATSMLSTAVGGKRVIISRIGNLKLNVWFLMIGASGLAYKTTPMTYFVYPLLSELTRQVSYPMILPSRYSLEGLIEYMSKGHNSGAMVRDEFTGLFKEAYNKQYLADILEFLSELYDGTMQKRYTRKAQLEESIDTYVCFLSATTPYLFRIMRPDFFIQGTGNRLLYIVHKEEKRTKYTSEEYFYESRVDQDRSAKIMDYAHKLAKVNQSQFKSLSPYPEAGALWLEYKEKCTDIAERRFRDNLYDVMYTYVVRLPEMALKMSGLHSISRTYEKLPVSHLNELIINEDDMSWGINKAEKHLRHFERMLEMWQTKPNPTEPHTFYDEVEHSVKTLKDCAEGLSWANFRRKSPWDIRTLHEVLKFLSDTSQITLVRGKSTPKGGVRPLLLFLKSDGTDYAKYGEIIGWSTFSDLAGMT